MFLSMPEAFTAVNAIEVNTYFFLFVFLHLSSESVESVEEDVESFLLRVKRRLDNGSRLTITFLTKTMFKKC